MNKKPIGDVCTFLPKSKIKAGEGKEIGQYPFFTSSDTQKLFVDEYLHDGEVLIIGTGGKPSCNYYKGKFAFSTDNFVLQTKQNLLCKYLYYFLRHNNLSILEKGFRGAGLKHIGKVYVKSVTVPIKGLLEQQSIVTILDKINELIDANKRQLELLDEAVKARFGEMFGDSFNSFGWPLHELESVVQINKCKSIPTLDSNERAWLLNLDMVESDTGKIIDFNMVDLDAIGSSTVKFDDSSILYSKLRPYLNKVVIPSKSGYATSEILVMNPSKKINRFFLATLLRSKNFVDFANSTSYGAKMPRASVSMIK